MFVTPNIAVRFFIRKPEFSDFNYRYRYRFGFLRNFFLHHCFSGNSWWKTNLARRFWITVAVAVAFYILESLVCITVTVLVTAKIFRNLICKDCGWDGGDMTHRQAQNTNECCIALCSSLELLCHILQVDGKRETEANQQTSAPLSVGTIRHEKRAQTQTFG